MQFNNQRLWIVFKADYLVKLAISFFRAQSLISCIVNKLNSSILSISPICYRNYIILIAKVNTMTINLINVRSITNNCWCSNRREALAITWCPDNIMSNHVLYTMLFKVQSLSIVIFSLSAILIYIMNRLTNSIITLNVLSLMTEVYFKLVL